jgi:hypothetical protein
MTTRQILIGRLRDALRPEPVAPASEYVYRSPERRQALIASAFGVEPRD